VLAEQVVDPAAQARYAVQELVGERPVTRPEPGRGAAERHVEAKATPDGRRDLEGGAAGGGDARFAQSSIPSVGDDGTAISRDGMRPARKA